MNNEIKENIVLNDLLKLSPPFLDFYKKERPRIQKIIWEYDKTLYTTMNCSYDLEKKHRYNYPKRISR